MASSPVSHAQVKELLRRAVLTLAAVPDSDLRYRLGPKTGWPPIVRDWSEYGTAPAKMKTFHPTSRDLSMFLDVLGMLAWYEREFGSETVRLFRSWSFGLPMWMLQERCSTNRRQPASKSAVYNRLDAMVRTIMGEFPEQLFRYAIDEIHELDHRESSSGEDKNSASDAFDLPKPSKNWSAPAEIISAADRAAARKALEKQLIKNKSRALNREQKAARR